MKLGRMVSAALVAAALAAPAAAQRAQAPRLPIPAGYYVYAERACGETDTAMYFDGQSIHWLSTDSTQQPSVERIQSVTGDGGRDGWSVVFEHDPSTLAADGPDSVPPGLDVVPAGNGRFMIGQFAADEMKICSRDSLPAALRRR